MNPFDYFPEAVIPCTFLELAQGGVLGNSVTQEYPFEGIFKERRGMIQSGNIESVGSGTIDRDSTLHIKPTETFIPLLQEYSKLGFLGCGIRVTKNGITSDYRITGYPEGYDFDTGVNEFFWLSLKAESLV